MRWKECKLCLPLFFNKRVTDKEGFIWFWEGSNSTGWPGACYTADCLPFQVLRFKSYTMSSWETRLYLSLVTLKSSFFWSQETLSSPISKYILSVTLGSSQTTQLTFLMSSVLSRVVDSVLSIWKTHCPKLSVPKLYMFLESQALLCCFPQRAVINDTVFWDSKQLYLNFSY